ESWSGTSERSCETRLIGLKAPRRCEVMWEAWPRKASDEVPSRQYSPWLLSSPSQRLSGARRTELYLVRNSPALERASSTDLVSKSVFLRCDRSPGWRRCSSHWI